MVLPSSTRRTVNSSSGQRAIAIVLFVVWLIFRLVFSRSSSSLVHVNTSAETAIIKDTSSKGVIDLGATSSIELEETIRQSAPALIGVQQKNNQAIKVASKQEPPQQQQQQQPLRQYNKLTVSGAGTVQHGATLEHPSLRNKMRRYREVKRDEFTPKADVLPHHYQKFVDGINYVEIDSGRDDVKRYAAVIERKQPSSANNDESNNYEAVTIRAWMTIVSSGNPIGNQAAAELSKVIASSPFDSVLFETPGCNWNHSSMKPFEFVLVNQPNLKAFAESNPDRHAFEEYFTSQSCSSSSGQNDGGSGPVAVCAFPNLGRDATLISPLPQSGINEATYSHLASFIRNAPQEQISQFWKVSAKTYIEELKHKHERINEHVGTWFSTNGMGVAWLHLRIDSVPKYYSYLPFTKVLSQSR
mmetsp:Transcript_18181/g.29808  ORF Transcript_18181/g.29808 Transcript_18181/m.29808 type:complete len:415 (+) Transcript_18181:113-1357(+)